jgi:hypothetical protein
MYNDNKNKGIEVKAGDVLVIASIAQFPCRSRISHRYKGGY